VDHSGLVFSDLLLGILVGVEEMRLGTTGMFSPLFVVSAGGVSAPDLLLAGGFISHGQVSEDGDLQQGIEWVREHSQFDWA
jgi:hypothetical protein